MESRAWSSVVRTSRRHVGLETAMATQDEAAAWTSMYDILAVVHTEWNAGTKPESEALHTSSFQCQRLAIMIYTR